ncbi:MAG: hypothetical protein JO181_18100 [Solirubrobacterales bacterium]|nr:hypothetical protein [Solirubrobacterales bacterium]
MRDMVRLERLGIPTAAVATEPFVDEALEQARALGMPDYRMVFIPHPVQLLTLEELHAHAERAFEEIVARLTQPARAPASVAAGITPPMEPRAGAARPRS